jgi:hypothetical protein
MDSTRIPEWVGEQGTNDYSNGTVYFTTISPILATTTMPRLAVWLQAWNETLPRWYKLGSAGYGQVYTVLKIKGAQEGTVQIRDGERVMGGPEVLFSMLLSTEEKYECMRLLISNGKVDVCT